MATMYSYILGMVHVSYLQERTSSITSVCDLGISELSGFCVCSLRCLAYSWAWLMTFRGLLMRVSQLALKKEKQTDKYAAPELIINTVFSHYDSVSSQRNDPCWTTNPLGLRLNIPHLVMTTWCQVRRLKQRTGSDETILKSLRINVE